MKEIDEELQIMKAAGLADKEAPVDISGRRARRFVAQAVGGRSDRMSPAYVWGGALVAAAACVVAAVFLFTPSSRQGGMQNTCEPLQSVHASTAVADTLSNVDTAEIQVSEIVVE